MTNLSRQVYTSMTLKSIQTDKHYVLFQFGTSSCKHNNSYKDETLIIMFCDKNFANDVEFLFV